MQKIILFVEPIDDAFLTPLKIGYTYMNRFAIDDNASFEILKVLELGKTSFEMSWPDSGNYMYDIFVEKIQQKGMDHCIVIINDKINMKSIRYFDIDPFEK